MNGKLHPDIDQLSRDVADFIRRRWKADDHVDGNGKRDGPLLKLAADLHRITTHEDMRRLLQNVRDDAQELNQANTDAQSTTDDKQVGLEDPLLKLVNAVDDSLRNSSKYSNAVEKAKRGDHGQEVVSVRDRAIVAVAILLSLSAHEDGRWLEVERLIKWSNKRITSDYDPYEDCLPLECAYVYVQFGRASSDGETSMTQGIPSVSRLNELLARIDRVTGTEASSSDPDHPDPDHVFRWSFHLLCSSIVLLPYTLLSPEGAAKEWATWVHTEIRRLVDTADGTSSRRVSYLHYLSLAKIEYAIGEGELEKAVEAAALAVQTAKPFDQRFISEARQFHSSLSLEAHLRQTTSATIDSYVESGKKDIDANTEDLRGELQEEVRSALLRVVEVLSVFIAVLGIVATSIAGIVEIGDEQAAWKVFGVGYISVILLFVILRWIVHGREAFGMQRRRPERALVGEGDAASA